MFFVCLLYDTILTNNRADSVLNPLGAQRRRVESSFLDQPKWGFAPLRDSTAFPPSSVDSASQKHFLREGAGGGSLLVLGGGGGGGGKGGLTF